MSVVGNSYLIPLVKGRSDLLRIPKEVVNDLGIEEPATVILAKPDGRKLTVRYNPIDRTIVGLKEWLKTCNDENIKSVRLTASSINPLSFAVDFSDQASDLVSSIGDVNTTLASNNQNGARFGGLTNSTAYNIQANVRTFMSFTSVISAADRVLLNTLTV